MTNRFELVISTMETQVCLEYTDYSTAIGMYYTFLGNAILQLEDKEIVLLINENPMRITSVEDGRVVNDYSVNW